jgi:hypothetical protein
MPERDANKEALDQVEKATESEPVFGEELLESQDLQRQLREATEAEAKERLKHEPPSP